MPCMDWLRSLVITETISVARAYGSIGSMHRGDVKPTPREGNRCCNKSPLQPLCYTISAYNYRKLHLRSK